MRAAGRRIGLAASILLLGAVGLAPLASGSADPGSAWPPLPQPVPARKLAALHAPVVLPQRKPLRRATVRLSALPGVAAPARPGIKPAVFVVPAEPGERPALAERAIKSAAFLAVLRAAAASADLPRLGAAKAADATIRPAPAATPMPVLVAADEPAPPPVSPQPTRRLAIDVYKSAVVHLARPARDVLVSNPAVADVVLRSTDAAFVIGKKVGETNVYFLDADGHQIDQVDVNILFDSSAVTAALKRAIPNEQIDVTTANQSVILTGNVASQQVAENAQQIARQFVTDDKQLVNLLAIRAKNQVLLRVKVTEMSRQTVKELGIVPGFPVPFSFNVNGVSFSLGGNAAGFTQAPFAGLGLGPQVPPPGATSSTSFSALLQALESNGIIKTLAEPNMTSVSGESASFLVGGEFPVPVPSVGANNTATVAINYQPFGIQLVFTPIVLADGLISLRISTEVSQLSTQGQITEQGFNIPALSVRRAQTTVELPSGGSIAIAGLLQNDIQNTIQGIPGLMSLPILGALFSSKQFQRQETDLVIAVTPLLVKPVDPNAIVYPSDGFGPASDFNMYFLGRLQATYTKPTPEFPRGRPQGPFGFILE